MFDSTLAKPARRGRLGVLVSVSLHIGLGAALLVSSFWKIDRLEAKTTPVTFSNVAALPMPPGAAAPPPPPASKSKAVKRPRPTEITQPVETPKPPEPEATAEPSDGDPDGEEGGETGGKVGGTPGGKGDLPGGDPNGVIGGDPNLRTDAAPVKTQIVPAVMLEGARVSGRAQIPLPEPVVAVLRGQGLRGTKAVVKLCLDQGGVPQSTTMLTGTGFDAADTRILSEMKGWRYRPYLVNGRPVGVCTSIVFQYKLTD